MKEININNFEEKLFYEKLENGLEVFLVPLKNKKSFFTMFGTKFGGAHLKFKVDEKEYIVPSGVAHFLEHKLFEQDETPFEFYGRSGTDVNASTSTNWTGYYFSGNNSFMENLKYLLNWITNFHITDEQVEKEKGIILEEARMYQDNPDRIIYEKIKENTLINSSHRQKVIGTLDSIKEITKEDLYLCYESFYSPSNMFLIIVGDFPLEETIKVIKEELKDFKDKNNKVTKIIEEEPNHVGKEKEILSFPVETPKVAVSYKIDKKDFDGLNLDKYFIDYYIQMLLTLAFGTASDFREYLLAKELFVSVGYNTSDIDTHYLIEFFATSNKPNELIEELDKYIKNIKNITFEEDDFNRIRKTWIASEVRMIDNVNATLYNILDDILEYGEFKNNSIADKKNLNFEVLNTLKDNIKFDNKSTLIITNSSNNM